jgi:fatty acid desaturase
MECKIKNISNFRRFKIIRLKLKIMRLILLLTTINGLLLIFFFQTALIVSAIIGFIIITLIYFHVFDRVFLNLSVYLIPHRHNSAEETIK